MGMRWKSALVSWCWRSTRLRVGAAFSLLAAVLFLAVGLLSGEQVARMRQRDAGESLQQAARQWAQALSAGLTERYLEIGHAAQLQPLIGRQLDAEGWRRWLHRLQQSTPHYTWIGVADGHGRVQAATGGLLEGQDVSQRPWFTEGSRHLWLGDVHEAKLLASLVPAPPSGEPLRLFDIAAPVDGSTHNEVLGAHLSLAWAENLRRTTLASLPGMPEVEMRLLNAQGAWMLGPPLGPGTSSARQAMELALRAGPSPLTWDDGQRYLSAAARVAPVGPVPLGWTVLVRQPETVALAEAQSLRHRMWAYGLVGTLLFGLVGWWLAGRLTAPLRKVAEAAHRAADAAGTPLPPNLDEVSQLAATLARLITRLSERERSLLQLNGSLEERVQQRTESLRLANEDLSLFARSISHDLRGPIGSMGLLLRRVLDTDAGLSEASRHSIGTMAQECDQLGQLIQGLLDLGRCEQGELRMVTVPTRTMVEQAVDALRRQGRVAPGTEVVIGPLPDAQGDAVLLRQVWQNLLGNAFKFSAHAQPPRVEVLGLREGDEVVYQVQDNGVGFDPAEQHRLFGAFQRLHSAGSYPGTGLGLSIVQRLVQRHGGRVWAAPRAEGGALFGFALPQRPAPTAVLQEEQPQPALH